MKHLKIFEDFHTGPMRKPQGFLSKMAQGAKHALGFEKEADRESLRSIRRAIGDSWRYDWVQNIREIQPGVVIAWINDNPVTVNKTVPEILYKGRELDLHNIEDEVNDLYDTLLGMQDGSNSPR